MSQLNISSKEMFLVPDGLFGFNMEITRTTFFRGLAAEMLNNRKFFTGNENPFAWNINNGKYVREPERSSCGSNFVLLDNGGTLSYLEDTIYLEKGKTYTFRITYGECSCDTEILVSIKDYNKQIILPKVQGKYLSVSFDMEAFETGKAGLNVTLLKGNSLSVFALSLMDKDNYFGMRRDVIEMLKRLKPTYLRFPGGCCADHFEWKEGLKPIDERKPMDGAPKASFLFRNTHTQDVNDIGINEFIMLCRAVNTLPEYTMRLVLNDKEEARELVEYCNGDTNTKWGKVREEQGYKDPFDIKLWYIGNEIYYFGYGLEFDAEGAGKKTDEYIKAMRSADPSIKAIVGVCTGTQGNIDWSKKYIENIHEKYEYISYHRYNGTEIDSEESDLLHAGAVRKMVQDGKDFGLEVIKNEIFKDNFDRLSVDIDEWNYSWGLKGSNLMTLSNALMTHFMIKESKKYHITDARFFHPINEGMIDVDLGKAPLMDSSGVLFNLLEKHRSGIVLEATIDDKDIDVLATKHQNKTVVSLINRVDEDKVMETKEKFQVTLMKLGNVSGLDNNYSLESFHNESGNITLPKNSIMILEY